MKIVAFAGRDGRLKVGSIMRELRGEAAEVLYRCSEDLLRKAVTFTPIKEGTLRGSGNVAFSPGNRSVFGMKKVGRHRVQAKKVPDPNLIRRLGKGTTVDKLSFTVGFYTPYAEKVHEGTYKLGKYSQQANTAVNPKTGKARSFAGQIGPKFLSRGLAANIERYRAYLQTWAKRGTGTSGEGKRVEAK